MNSKQDRKNKRIVTRRLDHLAHVLATEVRKMVKPECLKEFDEITLGLLQTKEDVKLSKRHPIERPFVETMDD